MQGNRRLQVFELLAESVGQPGKPARDAAQFLSISKRSLSRLIAAKKIVARKDGPRTLVDVVSIKAYYESLPLKTDHASIVFGRRAHVVPRSRRKARRPSRRPLNALSDC